MLSRSAAPPFAMRNARHLVLPVCLLLASCASVPPPHDAMARASAQLQAARQAGAADSDPVDVDFAAGKLQQAQVAMSAKKYAKAADLAAESYADGQLAFTKARLATLRDRIHKQSAENERLRAQFLDKQQQLKESRKAASQGGMELPEQVLPQPAAPASSMAPAPATSVAPAAASSSAGTGEGGR